MTRPRARYTVSRGWQEVQTKTVVATSEYEALALAEATEDGWQTCGGETAQDTLYQVEDVEELTEEESQDNENS